MTLPIDTHAYGKINTIKVLKMVKGSDVRKAMKPDNIIILISTQHNPHSSHNKKR